MPRLTIRATDEAIVQTVRNSRYSGRTVVYVPLRSVSHHHQVAEVRRINQSHRVISRKRFDPLSF